MARTMLVTPRRSILTVIPARQVTNQRKDRVRGQAGLRGKTGLGPRRPGPLSLQYKAPAEKKGPYYQLSYTHKMKSRTQYVRPEWVDEIREQIEVYKRFRKLIERWID